MRERRGGGVVKGGGALRGDMKGNFGFQNFL